MSRFASRLPHWFAISRITTRTLLEAVGYKSPASLVHLGGEGGRSWKNAVAWLDAHSRATGGPGCATLAVVGRNEGWHRARTLRETWRRHWHGAVVCDRTRYGRGQIILRAPDSGVLCGGSEPRTDSHIAVFWWRQDGGVLPDAVAA